jgi:hypothetical protein
MEEELDTPRAPDPMWGFISYHLWKSVHARWHDPHYRSLVIGPEVSLGPRREQDLRNHYSRNLRLFAHMR